MMRFRAVGAALALLAAVGCGADPDAPAVDPYADPAAVQARLRGTLEDLAALGEKKTGTPAGWEAGDYVAARFAAAGLQDVHFEQFSFLRYDLSSSSLTVTVDGAELPMEHAVFDYSGVGSASGEVVDVGAGRAEDYAGLDVTGKVVLVTRETSFHRSSQYLQVSEHGGSAMLYISQSPDNLIQIGTVADPEDGLGPIPTITVGADDGQLIIDALQQGATVAATLAVDAAVSPATGRNVLGLLPGTSPAGELLLIGGHYDTWYAGSVDNGTGIAATIEVAEALASRPGRRYGLLLVGYDGEELGLFGGYDLLRDHIVANAEPVLGFVNFEMPAGAETGLRTLARTNDGPIEPALQAVDMRALYSMSVGLEVVPALFGGIIPTDIQGIYRSGLQGLTTACDFALYHTPEDTPDKVDVGFLATAVMRFEELLAQLDGAAAEDFGIHDSKLWRLAVTTEPAGDDLQAVIDVSDGAAEPQAGAVVQAWIDVDDFTRVHRTQAATDAAGQATVLLPAEALAAGSGERWLHVTAGAGYPQAERVLPLP